MDRFCRSLIAGCLMGSIAFSFALATTDDAGRKTPDSITPAPVFLTVGDLGTAILGSTLFTRVLLAKGGFRPYEFSSPKLPDGFTLTKSGVLSGIPTTAGIQQFTAWVADRVGTQVRPGTSADFSFDVVDPATITTTPVLQFVTSSIPNAVTGSPFAFQIYTLWGTGKLNFQVIENALPDGLYLSSGGTIFGRPTTVGTSSFTVQVSDSGGQTPATRAFTMTVEQGETTSDLLVSNAVYTLDLGAADNDTLTVTMNLNHRNLGRAQDIEGLVFRLQLGSYVTGDLALTATGFKLKDTATGKSVNVKVTPETGRVQFKARRINLRDGLDTTAADYDDPAKPHPAILTVTIGDTVSGSEVLNFDYKRRGRSVRCTYPGKTNPGSRQAFFITKASGRIEQDPATQRDMLRIVANGVARNADGTSPIAAGDTAIVGDSDPALVVTTLTPPGGSGDKFKVEAGPALTTDFGLDSLIPPGTEVSVPVKVQSATTGFVGVGAISLFRKGNRLGAKR